MRNKSAQPFFDILHRLAKQCLEEEFPHLKYERTDKRLSDPVTAEETQYYNELFVKEEEECGS